MNKIIISSLIGVTLGCLTIITVEQMQTCNVNAENITNLKSKSTVINKSINTNSKDEVVYFSTPQEPITISCGYNITKSLRVSYYQNSKDNDQNIYNVYISGNNLIGKMYAKFLNSHPKLLIKFLNHYGIKITQKQLR